jgi:hypothetical protein
VLFSFFSSFLFFIFLKPGWLHYESQAGLELEIALHQPSECWDYRHILRCLVYFVFKPLLNVMKLDYNFVSSAFFGEGLV